MRFRVPMNFKKGKYVFSRFRMIDFIILCFAVALASLGLFIWVGYFVSDKAGVWPLFGILFSLVMVFLAFLPIPTYFNLFIFIKTYFGYHNAVKEYIWEGVNYEEK